LGKQGYNIILSEDEYLADLYKWIENNDDSEEKPVNNIDYWIKKVLNNSNWEYEIKMDWSFSSSSRASNKIYNDPYVASWKKEDDKIISDKIIEDDGLLEKYAYIEGKESNRYNLLMKIAEAFEVFCRFEYEYDENYHIIGRKVIFYNNFINEKDGIVDFNYGYNTSHIIREMDSNDLISKMYVKSLSDTGLLAGEVSISDTEINKSGENYLLNFDYLYKIGTIAQE
jgi:hypothetical protein